MMTVKEFRKECGWNQVEFAEILKTSQAAISRLEVANRDVSVLSIEDLKLIAEYGGMSLEDVFELMGVSVYEKI